MFYPKTQFAWSTFAVLATSFAASAQSVVDEWVLETNQHIFSVAISPDGKILAAGNDNIHIYDITGTEPRQITVIPTRMFVGVRGLTFSPNGKRLAFGGSANKVHLWSVDGEPKELSVGKSHTADTQTFNFSRDGKLLASGSDDKTVILWNVGESGKLSENLVIKQHDKNEGRVRAVRFFGDSKLLAANQNGAIRLYSLTKDGKYKQDKVDKLYDDGHDPALAVRPDGKAFAISLQNRVGLYGGLKGQLTGHIKDVTGVAFSPDGSLIGTCGVDGRICIYTATSPSPKTTKERPDRLTCIGFTEFSSDEKPGAETMLAAAATSGKVFLYKVGLPQTKKK